MSDALENHGTRLSQVDGVGSVTDVRLIGRTGPASRFASAYAFATYAGVAPIGLASAEGTAIDSCVAATDNSTPRSISVRMVFEHEPDYPSQVDGGLFGRRRAGQEPQTMRNALLPDVGTSRCRPLRSARREMSTASAVSGRESLVSGGRQRTTLAGTKRAPEQE